MCYYSYRFTEVLEFAEDIELDVPKIWFYLAEVVVPVIEDGTISLDILTKAPSSIMESGKGAQLLAEVLKLSEKIMVGYCIIATEGGVGRTRSVVAVFVNIYNLSILISSQ